MTITVPLKHLARLNPETLGDDTDPDRAFRYIDIATTGRGVLIDDPPTMTFETSPSRARRVLRPGDTILSTVRTYLRAGWTVRGRDNDLVASTGFVCLRPRADIDPQFLGWYAQSDPVVEEVVANSVGVSYPAINPSDVGRIKVICPPLAVQLVIADYLDRETARIDALIAAKRRMVRLLEQRLWLAFISRVIAGNPKSTQLRRTFHSLIDGPFGSAFSSSDYSDEGAVVVRLGNIGFSHYRKGDQAHIPLALYKTFIPYRVVEGDLLIAGLGDDRNHAGRACVAPDLGPAIVKGKCFRARVDDSRASAAFLSLLLSSPLGAEAMNVSGRGSTRSMINLEIVKRTEIPLPDRDVQDWLVRDTQVDQARTLQMTEVLAHQIALLQERRQALITAAVTGQLDVPEAA